MIVKMSQKFPNNSMRKYSVGDEVPLYGKIYKVIQVKPNNDVVLEVVGDANETRDPLQAPRSQGFKDSQK